MVSWVLIVGQAGHGNTMYLIFFVLFSPRYKQELIMIHLNNADPSGPAENFLDIFTAHCMSGQLDRVQSMLQQWKSSETPSPPQGPERQPMLPFQPALQAAAMSNNASIVRYLLRQGLQVDPRTLELTSPKLHGFDINLSLGHIGDALRCVTTHVNYLPSRVGPSTNAFYSLAMGSDKISLVQWHLAHGADPNANLRGETYTALELGAIYASTETLASLLQHDARIQSTSALTLAAYYGRVKVVAFLLDYGAAIDVIPDNDHTYEAKREKGLGNALHTAARERKDEVVALLLGRGAGPEVKDSLGKSALELAESHGHSSIVAMLRGR